ncbi:MAG: DMT family transporter [Alphaproteobacteria bacterium]|nr:DMT family transporter [Alphaproteobacteria bacterium]
MNNNENTIFPLDAILILLVGVIAFAINDGLAQYLTDSYSPIQILWCRYLFGVLYILPAFFWKKNRPFFVTQTPQWQIIRGLTITASSVLFVGSLALLNIAEATAIGFASPFFVTILSIIFLKEKVSTNRWLAVIVGMIGIIIIVRPGTDAFKWGGVLGIAAAAFWALGLTFTRKTSKFDHFFTTLFFTMTVGLVASSFFVFFYWHTPDVRGWVVIMTMAAFHVVAQFLIIYAFSKAPASLLAPFCYSQLVWAALIGIICFGTMPDFWGWVGSLIIIGSGIYVWYKERLLWKQVPQTLN